MMQGKWSTTIAAVGVAAGMLIGGACTDDRPHRSAPSAPTASQIADGSCTLLSTKQIADVLGAGVKAEQIGTVSCGLMKTDSPTPVAMVSLTPGTIDLGNPLAVPVNDQAPTFDGVRTEWRQSALPSGIRLGATSNGWTITVDAASSVNNPGQAASKLMEIALRDLPSAG